MPTGSINAAESIDRWRKSVADDVKGRDDTPLGKQPSQGTSQADGIVSAEQSRSATT